MRYNICMVQTEPLSSYKRYLVMYMKFRGDPSQQIRNPQQQREQELRYEVSNEPLVLCDEAKNRLKTSRNFAVGLIPHSRSRRPQNN